MIMPMQRRLLSLEEAPVSKVVVQTEHEKFTADESSNVPEISKDFV